MQITSRKPTVFKHGNEADTRLSIWRRIMKYPPFATHSRAGAMQITHNLEGGGKVVADAPFYVTNGDAERLFAAIHLGEEAITKQLRGSAVTSVIFHISELRKFLGCHDDASLLDSLYRLKMLSISAFFPGSIHPVVTALAHEVEYDSPTGFITCLFNGHFYRACKEKGLTLNLTLYMSLTPTAKNIYSFIASNPREVFLEATLVERGVIMSARTGNRRARLYAALRELRGKGVIDSYEKCRNATGERCVEIKRIRN